MYIAALLLVAISSTFVAACRLYPALADIWLQAAFSPLAQAVSRIPGLLPFPLAEPLALLLAALAVFFAVRSRRVLSLLLSIVISVYALFWAPLYFAAARAEIAPASAAALEQLCAGLIDDLNASGPFQPPRDFGAEALLAAQFANTPAPVRAAPKFARYPEWMEAANLAGLYVPWTFEALLNPDMAAVGTPFTAVHELMHLGGVADEGQANIAAYDACIRHGGAFAYSAKLWALKYALMELRGLNPGIWTELAARMNDDVRADFRAINGFALSEFAQKGRAVEAFLRLNGMAEKTDSYGKLADYLCMGS